MLGMKALLVVVVFIMVIIFSAGIMVLMSLITPLFRAEAMVDGGNGPAFTVQHISDSSVKNLKYGLSYINDYKRDRCFGIYRYQRSISLATVPCRPEDEHIPGSRISLNSD